MHWNKTSLLLLLIILLSITQMSCKSDVGAEFPPGWPVTIAGEDGYCAPIKIDVDNDGNIYVTGMFGGSIDLDPGPGIEIITDTPGNEYGSTFLCKYDANGNYQWSDVRLHNTIYTLWYDILVDDDGYLYVTGYESGLLLLDSHDIPGQDSEGTWSQQAILSKYDPDGNIVLDLEWGLTSQGCGESEGKCVVVNKAGNIFVAGNFAGEADFDPGKGTHYMIAQGVIHTGSSYLACFDSNGQLQWVRTWGGRSHTEWVHDLELDSNGDLYVTGLTGVFDQEIIFDSGERILPETEIGSYGSFFTQFNDQGDLINAEFWGGPGDNDRSRAKSIAVSDSGQIYILGCYTGSIEININDNIKTYTSNGGWDIYLVAFDSTGSILWFNTWWNDEMRMDSAKEVFMNSSGDILCIGYSPGPVNTSLIEGDVTSIIGGDSQGYVIAFNTDGVFQWSQTWPNRFNTCVYKNDNLFFAGRYRETLFIEGESGYDERAAIGSSDGYIMPVHLPD